MLSMVIERIAYSDVPKPFRGVPAALIALMVVVALFFGGLAGYAIGVRNNSYRKQLDAANERMAGMTEAEWNDAKALEAAILEQLVQAKATGDPTGEAARELCAMHARWLQMHWGEGTYSPAAHAALAEGYVADPRFTAYYDGSVGEGATAFLRDALVAWCAEQ